MILYPVENHTLKPSTATTQMEEPTIRTGFSKVHELIYLRYHLLMIN